MQLSGVDMYGQPVQLSTNGWHARILQHETDHLAGRLYVDHMQAPHAPHQPSVTPPQSHTFAFDPERMLHVPGPEDVLCDGACFHQRRAS